VNKSIRNFGNIIVKQVGENEFSLFDKSSKKTTKVIFNNDRNQATIYNENGSESEVNIDKKTYYVYTDYRGLQKKATVYEKVFQ
jgi:hypothetical protein